MRIQLVVACLLLSCSFIAAQQVEVFVQPQVKRLMERSYFINSNTRDLEGYRVQLVATTDRQELEKTRTEFRILYGEALPLEWIHEKPWYKLRAGACLTRLEAQHLLFRLKEHYPGAYLTNARNIKAGEILATRRESLNE
ncbi:MAG: SPOR domain-containing protein [Saprospiraceae bacterium]|jgi:hypothetical protein